MKIVISHVFGTQNKGDWILVSEIIEILKLAFPDSTIYAITRDPESQSAVFPEVIWCSRLETSFKRNKLWRNLEIITGLFKIAVLAKFKFLFNLLKVYEPYLQIISSADLIVMCPGGYWDYSHPSFISNLVNLWLLVSCNKKIIFAPQSIEKINNLPLQNLFTKCISKAELIFVRESESYNYVNSLSIPKHKLFQVPDLAFYHAMDVSYPIAKKLIAIEAGKFIACTAVDWHFPNSPNPQKSHEKYIFSLAESAKYFYHKYGLPMFLVRQIGNSSKDGNGDIGILQEVEDISDGAARVIEDDLHPDELIYLLSKSLFLIGSRMHSNIFALLSARPVVAISYQKKTEGIMKMLSLQDYLISIDEITPNSLIAIAQNVYDTHQQLSMEIKSKISEIQSQKNNLIKMLQNI
ncbi:polysaccharide pyruvyl transferase family protein [Nostocales cyanobacterium LEGE 11386]|nr:polysaccharide pyruvyl transferase family protein [Nostocales cyanobacterium LEGE 11386]